MADKSMVDTMTGRFGKGVLKRPASGAEVYGMVDVLLEALKNHQTALAALEARLAAVEGHGLSFEGTHQRGKAYRRGHVCVADGSLWIATTDTTAAPGRTGAWALAAKAGRDGKDAR